MLPKNVSSIVTTNPNTTSDVSVFVTANVAVFWMGDFVVGIIVLFVRFAILDIACFFVRKIFRIRTEQSLLYGGGNTRVTILQVLSKKDSLADW